MTEAPLFPSTHAALAFAFSHHERAGKPNLLGKLSSKTLITEGRGLSGIDGAAQAGMILSEVFQLPEAQRSVIVCKFSRPSPCKCCGAPQDTTAKKESVELLAQLTLSEMQRERPNLNLRRALVRRHYGERRRLEELARSMGVHQNTIITHGKKVSQMLAKLEREAMHHLDGKYSSIVGQPEIA